MAQWDVNLEIPERCPGTQWALGRYVPGPTSCVAAPPHIWRLRLNNRDSLNEFEPFTALTHLHCFLFWDQLTAWWPRADRWLSSTSEFIVIPKEGEEQRP